MYYFPLTRYSRRMAFIALKGGGGLWAMGSAEEVEAALADEFFHFEGKAVLRWAHSESEFLLDPKYVLAVHDSFVSNRAWCPDCDGVPRAPHEEPCSTCDGEGLVG